MSGYRLQGRQPLARDPTFLQVTRWRRGGAQTVTITDSVAGATIYFRARRAKKHAAIGRGTA